MAQINSLGQRGGAMTGTEVLTGNLEFYTIFTTLDITATGDYSDNSQKDFESVIQVIGLRSMPVLMNEPVYIDGTGGNTLDAYGAPSLTGDGYILRFSFEHTGAHTVDTLKNELHGIVLNGGVIDTLNSVNMEFTKQELL
jgi:hypothetical protein